MYQNQQGDNVFNGTDYIVSFIGEGGRLSRFIGVYKILSEKKLPDKKPSVDGNFYRYEYSMEEVDGFEDMKERVIVDWGASTRAWHQWIDNKKEIIEIHPGLHYKQFTDYFDFVLDFRELKEITDRQYRDWKRMLTATKGIYLISDSKTGQLYVGSAYGDDGIWGRWTTYATTNGHGNNKKLKELLAKDNNYGDNFRFSILMLLPRTVTPDQAIQMERLFKKKLGTNSFGLNSN